MHIFDKLILYNFYLSFLTFFPGMIGVFILMLDMRSELGSNRKRYRLFGDSFIIIMIFTFILLATTSHIFSGKAKDEFTLFLNSGDLTVKLNGVILKDPDKTELVSDLKNILFMQINRPGNEEFFLELFNKTEHYSVKLKSDSIEKNLFWVYLLKYESTKSNDIGKFRTDILKGKSTAFTGARVSHASK